MHAKSALWPFHGWLPELHVESSTEVSVCLASILLKVGWIGVSNVLCASDRKHYCMYFVLRTFGRRRCELRTYDYWTKRTFLYRLKKTNSDVVFVPHGSCMVCNLTLWCSWYVSYRLGKCSTRDNSWIWVLRCWYFVRSSWNTSFCYLFGVWGSSFFTMLFLIWWWWVEMLVQVGFGVN